MMDRVISVCLLCVFCLISSCYDDERSRFSAGTDSSDNNREKIIEKENGTEPPNILLIVADDLGYTDFGAFGGEIETPNLDSLANSGVMLTNFHTAPTCSPTRSMLLSGTDNHLAGLGAMYSYMKVAAPEQLGKPGYEGYLNDRVAPLAELLKDAGYNTYMSGKWHLGLDEEVSAKAKGFDKSFTLLQGGGGHFTDLGIGDEKARYREDGVEVSIPEDFYSSRFYAHKMIDYIKQGGNDKPFFAYLAFTAPHWPLQAPAPSIQKYEGRYQTGYEEIYRERLVKQKALGLIVDDAKEDLYSPAGRAWDSLTEEEKRVSQRKMEIYAAMIDDLDKYVGEVIGELKKTGQYDNTLILFMSDNGAQAGDVDAFPGLAEWLLACCDNSYENMGKPNSYLFTGKAWARVSTGISRLYKGSTAEGGILAPAFIHYPRQAVGGKRYDGFLSVMDVMPTLLELAGIEYPGMEYKGRPVLPMKGKSFTPVLRGSEQPIHAADYVMGWELHGNQALRQGDWKIVFNKGDNDNRWGLYNLNDDPEESLDLSGQQPERLEQMLGLWDQYVRDNGVILHGAVKQ